MKLSELNNQNPKALSMSEESELELSVLKDNQRRYQIAAATERQTRDAMVATWRDLLHAGMKSPLMADLIKVTHAIMDDMDEFLRRSKS